MVAFIELTTSGSDITKFLGDEVCDDFLNVDFYHYDMGDCCDSNADRSTCEICLCNVKIIQSLGDQFVAFVSCSSDLFMLCHQDLTTALEKCITVEAC